MIDEIIKMYYDSVFKYCRSALNGNTAAAEDVTQEVFLALHNKQKWLTLDKNIKYWLFRAADFEIKKYIRKQHSYVPLDELPEELLPTVEENYQSIGDDTLSCLTDEEKKLLVDYYNSEDRRKIAKDNHIPMDTLYMRIHRIKMRLAKHLNDTNKIKT